MNRLLNLLPIVLWLLFLGGALLYAPRTSRELSEPQRMEVFDFVWRTVRDSHYDPKLNGVNWQAVRQRYKPKVRAARSDEEFYGLLNEMVGELKQSHFAVYPPGYLIASQRARGLLADGEVGMTAQLVDGQVIITRVYEDSPASRSGLRPGDQILTLDGTPVQQLMAELREPVNRQIPHYVSTPATERFLTYYVLTTLLNGRAGTEVRLRCRTLAGEEREFTLTRAPIKKASEPIGLLPPIPLRVQTRMLDDNIGYIAFNAFLPAVMEPVRKAVREMRSARALIIDLRENMGGIGLMAGGIAGLLTDKEIPMGVMRMREGSIPIMAYPQPGAFKGRVVILTDEATVSTAEIMAGALKEAGRATVIGRPTPGYALPAKLVELPYGGLLSCVIADYRTPKGRRLEGVGVKPDIEVSLTRDAFRRSSDPILQAAIDHLQRY